MKRGMLAAMARLFSFGSPSIASGYHVPKRKTDRQLQSEADRSKRQMRLDWGTKPEEVGMRRFGRLQEKRERARRKAWARKQNAV